jgi:hypothetical protein
MKTILKILLLFFVLSMHPAIAQNEMFQEKPERKKLWKKWRKNRQSYNPYLDKKGKNKPSARIAKGDRKDIKRSNRQAKRQMRRSKRKTGYK